MSYFYRGKFFEKEEEWLEYVKNWPDQLVDLDCIRGIFETILRDIKVNSDMVPMTNRQAMQLTCFHAKISSKKEDE